MKFQNWIPATCPNCGANMSVSKDNERADCPYCGTSFRANQAIAKFNATYMTNHINTNVAYFGDSSKDFEIVAGELKSYTGSSVDVVIPDGVETIRAWAFASQGIHSVSIPINTTVIEEKAFYGCTKLAQVKMSRVRRIGHDAFHGCSMLKEIRLPISLVEIGQAAFFGTKLKTVTILHKGALASGRAFMSTPLEEINILCKMNDFFDRKSWSEINPLFIGLDNLRAIVFKDCTLTPDNLEKRMDFADKDNYAFCRTVFTGNYPFGEAMNRRLKKCLQNGVCPICFKKTQRAYTTIFTKTYHPQHCSYCDLDVDERYLGVGLDDPNSYDCDYD